MDQIITIFCQNSNKSQSVQQGDATFNRCKEESQTIFMPLTHAGAMVWLSLVKPISHVNTYPKRRSFNKTSTYRKIDA